MRMFFGFLFSTSLCAAAALSLLAGCAGYSDIPKSSHAYAVRKEANAYRTQYNRLKTQEQSMRRYGDIIGAAQVRAMKDEAYAKYREKLEQAENAAARYRKRAAQQGARDEQQ